MLHSNRRARAATIGIFSAAISLGLPWAARASTISGSEGRVTIIGNDASNSTGSFSVDVAYEVFNGQSATDPLGITNNFQIAFVLKHNGVGDELPALKLGRFTVFAPDPASTTVAYYGVGATINPLSAGQFLIGPSGSELDPFAGLGTSSTPNIDPPPTGANRVRFLFQTGLQQANFPPDLSSGPQYSQLLVVAPAAGSTLPANVVIELNGTDTVPGVHGDTTIPLVPEPGTCALIALGLGALLRGRRRGS
jgi:hypothetical protein